MEPSEKFVQELIRLVSRVSQTAAALIQEFSHLAASIQEVLEDARDRQQWWKQGIAPDEDGVYPDGVFERRCSDDDLPPYDLSA